MVSRALPNQERVMMAWVQYNLDFSKNCYHFSFNKYFEMKEQVLQCFFKAF